LLSIQRTLNVEVTNIVIMGMGEPFLNYDEVIKACEIISHDKGIAIGKRKITISTSGIVPAIKRFTDEGQRYKLAISLNTADNVKRNQLMPINKKYPLNELINAARYYAAKSRHRITFEYVMIDGLNDGIDDALKLAKLINGLKCKINIIPCNSIDKKQRPPSEETINTFIRPFLNMNVVISVRRSKGVDIDAACGQLYHNISDTVTS
jgi:23S rRNA (adenine2503-C2)-methyltransferase